MRLRIFTALLPIFAAPVFAAINTNNLPDFDDLVRQGRAAFLASDLNRAESAYNQACPAELVRMYPVAKMVTCENLLASVDEARGNLARAERRFLQAVADAEQAGPAYRPLYCARLIDLGEYYHHRRQAAQAETTLLKATGVARTVITTQPELLPEALIRLGELYSDSAQPERGRAPLEEALGMIAAAGGEESRKIPVVEIALAHNALGMIELSAGRPREAESKLRESVALATKELGEDDPVTAAYQTNLALALIAQRQFADAGLLLRRAEYVVTSRESVPGVELAVICAEMSDVAGSEGKLAQAEEYALRAISILGRQQRPDPRAIAIAQVTLAGIYLRAHDVASAEGILPAAVESQRANAPGTSSLAASVQLLGELREQQRNWPAAEALYREAINLYARSSSPGVNPAAAPVFRALAEVLKHEGRPKDEVRAIESQARDILRSASQATPRV